MFLVHQDLHVDAIVDHAEHAHDFEAADMGAEEDAAAAIGRLFHRGVEAVQTELEARVIASDEVHPIENCACEAMYVTENAPPADVPSPHPREKLTGRAALLRRGQKEVQRYRIEDRACGPAPYPQRDPSDQAHEERTAPFGLPVPAGAHGAP